MLTIKRFSTTLLLTLSSFLLLSCGSENTKPAKQQTARFEAKSSCGNEPTYTIKGKTYKVLESAMGYKKDATASWYGAAFQGSKTASCETFDMFAHTAAHRTLPLPSYVKVTNKKNNKSVIVKVNDRGPFDSNHEIELSFAAANAIGMIKSKQAAVHLEALTPEQFEQKIPNTPSASKTTPTNKPAITRPRPAKSYAKMSNTSGPIFYVVVGTYRTNNEAVDMFVRLLSIGINKTEMATAYGNNRELYMVRVGPLYGQDQIDNIKDRLTQDGLTSFKVVND
jgi:rare lipoprotein A